MEVLFDSNDSFKDTKAPFNLAYGVGNLNEFLLNNRETFEEVNYEKTQEMRFLLSKLRALSIDVFIEHQEKSTNSGYKTDGN